MKYISYLRVSTDKQGKNGYGIKAQRDAIKTHLSHKGDYELLAEYKEVESGRKPDRKQLQTALRRCRQLKATLIIAKLDRLTRSLPLLIDLEESGVDFEFVELPSADKTTIRLLVTVAEREAELISRRTKEALAIVKANGTQLGNPNLRKKGYSLGNARTAEIARKAKTQHAINWAKDYLPDLDSAERKAKKEKVAPTLQYIADHFNEQGLKTRRGKQWTTRNIQLLKQKREHISQ